MHCIGTKTKMPLAKGVDVTSDAPVCGGLALSKREGDGRPVSRWLWRFVTAPVDEVPPVYPP